MPRAIADSSRIELRIDAAAKAKLARAAALEHTDLTAFILRAALPAAETVIERAERITLSERDRYKGCLEASARSYSGRKPDMS